MASCSHGTSLFAQASPVSMKCLIVYVSKRHLEGKVMSPRIIVIIIYTVAVWA